MSAPSIEERRDCPHGHQWGKCDVCDRMECERELAAMTVRAEAAEREVDRCAIRNGMGRGSREDQGRAVMRRLYHVLCRGMQHRIAGGVAHGDSYVVAENSEEAYQTVRRHLDLLHIGFAHEREMKSVELIATEENYSMTGHALFIATKVKEGK